MKLSYVLLGVFLFVCVNIPILAFASMTVTPQSSGTDDLIGATNAVWVFTATTTGGLADEDVIQFGFPSINMGPPFSLDNVSLVATSGFSIFQNLNGSQLSNQVINPSFETASGTAPYVDGWSEFNYGSSTVATSSVASVGSVSMLMTSATATSTGALELSAVAPATASTNYTVSFYARGVTGGEFARLTMLGDGNCGGDDQLYNFSSSTFECVTPDAGTYASTSPYVSATTTATSYARYVYTVQTAGDMSEIEVAFIAGGDLSYDTEAVYYDALQVEEGTTATAFNLGGGGSPTAGVQGTSDLLFGYVDTSIATGTAFSFSFGSITNSKGSLGQMSDLEFGITAGTPVSQQQPMGDLTESFSATSSASLIRSGGSFVTDNNSVLEPSTYTANATTSFDFGFTSSSSIPSGGKIHINFPSEYSLSSTSLSTQTINGGSVQVTNVNMTTVSSGGENRIVLTTSGGATAPGDAIIITIDGLRNPSDAGVYRPFYIFTTLANDGLLDGSYFGFEESDFDHGQPPPVDSIHIGGDNTLVVRVLKETATTTVELSGAELTQVKVGAGCPDKRFFVGERWLDPDSQTTYSNLLDCNYFVGAFPLDEADKSFYNTFLPPGMKQIQALDGGTATATITFGVPDATSTIVITGGVPGEVAFVEALSDEFQTFSDVFTDTSYTTAGFDGSGIGYALLRLKSGRVWNFTVGSGNKGEHSNFIDGGSTYWPPQVPDFNIDTAGTYDLGTHAYILANNTLTVSIDKTSGGSVTDACVGVKRSGGGFFMELQDVICQPNNGNDYEFIVPVGSISIEVMRPGYGAAEEYPIGINSSSTSKTISVSVPTSYISISVTDSGGNALTGAPVFAHGSNGFVDGVTNSAGTTTLYVQPGTYTVEGFAPGFGSLTSQSKTVTEGSNPSASFTVDSGSLRTVSGTVTQGGNPIEGFQIGAHGVSGTEGGNGTVTGSDGTYVLYLPAGEYKVGGWSPSTGGLPELLVDVTSGNASGKNWTLGGSGTLGITITGGADLDQIFAGAFDPTTGRGNGIDTWSTSGQSKTADITLPAGTYDLHIGSPVTGELTSVDTQVTITSGGTTNVVYSATSSSVLVTLSGTVSSGGSGVSNASVWASRIGAPGFYSAQTDGTGAYSFTVPDDETYAVGVRMNSYVASGGDEEVVVSGNATQNFTLTTAGATITGTLQDSGSGGVANGWVSAQKTVGGNEVWTGAPTDAAGDYSLSVDTGSTWTIYGEGPCYTRSAGTSAAAGATGANITLQDTDGCSIPVPQLNSVTPATGGQVSKDDLTLDIPSNALGTGQSSVSVRISDADLSVASSNATPLPGSVKTITVTDGSGQSISSLDSNATLAITYDPDELPVGFDEADLQFGYFDSTTGTWEAVAATVDTDNNIITANVSHFTDYGPILPGVPIAPTGASATADSDTQITVTWSLSATADYYTIYRSLTDSNFTTSIGTTTSVSYVDTGRSASTVYYYKVAGINGNGEGFNSTSVSATADSESTSGGGGSSRLQVTVPSVTPVEFIPAETVIPVSVPNSTVAFGQLRSRLGLGDESPQVTLLQQMLASDADLYPNGLISGYFGSMTQAAVQKFQVKYQIVSEGTPSTTGYGSVGPSTLAKLNAVFATVIVPVSTAVAPAEVSGRAELRTSLSVGMEEESVRTLQIILNSDSETQLAVSGIGSKGNESIYFGVVTEAAVQKFQFKYGLAKAGDDYYGFVGPQTRAQLNEILADMDGKVVSAGLSTEARAQIAVQIVSLLEQVKLLQAELVKIQSQ
ncbi:MAG: peptidoglycan hydrolase-like protein with peptidoglycan-binding domain [Acidimicrobiales bacterium]|jgi:peptidoglycan hydrolase-like protein with peptidoglycan-binding domain